MKYFYSLFFTIIFSSVYSQETPTLPADSILISSLEKYNNAKTKSEIKPYEISKKRSWHLLLPSFGLAYNLQGKPRPSISINPLNFINYKYKIKELKNLETSLILKNKIEHETQVSTLLRKISNFNLKIKIYNLNTKISKINSKLNEITEEKYNQKMIKPSDYLKNKKNQIQLEKSNLVELNEIVILYNDILNFAKHAN